MSGTFLGEKSACPVAGLRCSSGQLGLILKFIVVEQSKAWACVPASESLQARAGALSKADGTNINSGHDNVCYMHEIQNYKTEDTTYCVVKSKNTKSH